MNVTIVGFKQPQPKSVVEERKIIVHTTAGNQANTPRVRVIAWRSWRVITRVIYTDAINATGQAVGKQRVVLQWQAEDRACIVAKEPVILTRRARHHSNLTASVAVDVVGDTTHRTNIHRRKLLTCGLDGAMHTKVRIPRKNIDTRGVGSIRQRTLSTDTSYSKTDRTCSQ